MKKLICLFLVMLGQSSFAQTFPVNNLQINGAVTGNVTGTGNVVLATAPTVTLPNATGLPITTGVTGLGTGVATALGTAVTGSGGPVLATNPTITNLSATAENITYLPTFAPGVRAPLFIWQNPTGSSPAGTNAGQQIWIGDNPTATPGAGDTVASTIAVVNGNGRNQLYGQNMAMLACGAAEGCTTGYVDSRVVGQEIDVGTSASYTAQNSIFNPTGGTNPVVGLETYCDSNSDCTTGYGIWGNDSTGNKWFHNGIEIARVANVGIHFENISGDSVASFASAAIQDDSNSTNVIAVGAGTHSFILLAPNTKITTSGLIIPGSFNVSTLPTCAAGTQGAIAYVHDAAAPTYNTVLSGGGGTAVLAFCNGSSWTAH